MCLAMCLATRGVRCRVCHRELKNAAHIAAGIGPECAKKSASAGGRAVTKPAYPVSKLARIERNINKLTRMLDNASAFHWTAEDRALVAHWLRRWRGIQARVRVARG
jgi:hypothetical protein